MSSIVPEGDGIVSEGVNWVYEASLGELCDGSLCCGFAIGCTAIDDKAGFVGVSYASPVLTGCRPADSNQ